MADDLVPQVKLIIKAIKEGIDLAGIISQSTESATAEKALQISETVPNVHKSLVRSSQAILAAYRQCAETSGQPFAKALIEDKSVQNRLKKLKNEVRDRIDDCEGFEDAAAYDPEVFTSLQNEVENCSIECIAIFQGLRDKFAPTSSQSSKAEQPPNNDRAQLPTMRQKPSSLRKPVPPSAAVPLQVPSPPEPAKPMNPWSINGPSQFEIGSMNATLGASSRRESARDISPKSPGDSQPRLIRREIVHYRLNANDEFLARRQQSRIDFQNEFRKSSVSIEENRAGEISRERPLVSPILGSSAMSASPIDGRRSRTSLNGYDVLVTRQRSLGQGSQGTRSSRTSSIVHDRQAAHRQDSEDSIFGLRVSAPLSPPLSEHRSSGGNDRWGGPPLASTLKVPGFGSGIEPGIEAVTHIDYENEKIAVASEASGHPQPTPTSSIKSVDCLMRPDSSFYKFGGFCDGARAMMRGEIGFKVVKRPSGHYSATVSGRCIKCSYEVGWNDLEKDRMLERTGIYGNSGIRWRQKFISKCHLRTNSIEASVYACIFCIEEARTVEDHDATVFFSVAQLFRHLATHPRPLPNVPGIDVIYGQQRSDVVDFDLHFTTSEPAPHQYNIREIAPKVATRPMAVALTTHHPKNGHSNSRDPDGEAVLHFAAGAKIVGITFPERFGGHWCVGYHDGSRGSFLASTVTLELPAKEDISMNSQSTLIAIAKRDFKPKEARDGGWLKFSKGDKISSIGYTFPDHWCFSGQTSKGRWGLFPACFVEGLRDEGKLASSAGSTRTSGFNLSSKIPSFPLGRKKSSRHDRSESITSNGSGGSAGSGRLGSGMVQAQPGLEVVPSPIHAHAPSGSWGR